MEKTDIKNKLFKIINTIFAYIIVASPMIISFLAVLTMEVTFLNYIVIYTILYLLFLLVYFVYNVQNINWTKIKEYLKNIIVWAIAIIYLIMIISCIINKTSIVPLLRYISFICIFINFISIGKEDIKPIIYTLITSMSISCILGFIDCQGSFIPGFLTYKYNFSLHFYNPNYSGYIMSMMLVLCACLFDYSKIMKDKIFLSINFIIFEVFLYVNGSFVPIVASYICLLILIIFRSVKRKKLSPTFYLLLVMIASSFLLELIPGINEVRNSDGNFFLECIAVFDNIFHTNLLKLFGRDSFLGSDGWDRHQLLIDSIMEWSKSFRSVILGYGAEYFVNPRPHNNYISLLVDFGLFVPLIYIGLLIVLIVRTCKSSYAKTQFYLYLPIICYLLCSFFGSLVFYSYVFVVIFIALLTKSIKEKAQIL